MTLTPARSETGSSIDSSDQAPSHAADPNIQVMYGREQVSGRKTHVNGFIRIHRLRVLSPLRNHAFKRCAKSDKGFRKTGEKSLPCIEATPQSFSPSLQQYMLEEKQIV